MSFRASEYRAEIEAYKAKQTYYQAIRNPKVEWTTFVLALLGSLTLFLARLGFVPVPSACMPWVLIYCLVSFVLFAALDAMIAKTQNPFPEIFGPLNAAGIYEKFAAQERMWQMALIVMLPVTARLIGAIMFLKGK